MEVGARGPEPARAVARCAHGTKRNCWPGVGSRGGGLARCGSAAISFDVGDGANEPHGTTAVPTCGDIDGEHAREKRGPPHASRRTLVRRRGPRLPRPQAGGVEQQQVHRSCGGRRGELWRNAGAQAVMIRENAEVAHLVLPGRRDQADQARQEAHGFEVDMRGTRGGDLRCGGPTRSDRGIRDEPLVQQLLALVPWLAFACTDPYGGSASATSSTAPSARPPSQSPARRPRVHGGRGGRARRPRAWRRPRRRGAARRCRGGDELPMIVAIHGLGDEPQNLAQRLVRLGPVRDCRSRHRTR